MWSMCHDEVKAWKRLPHYWSSVREFIVHCWIPPRKGQKGGTLAFCLMLAWPSSRDADISEDMSLIWRQCNESSKCYKPFPLWQWNMAWILRYYQVCCDHCDILQCQQKQQSVMITLGLQRDNGSILTSQGDRGLNINVSKNCCAFACL